MKKLLLFVFILLGFIAKSQELDELYIRDALYIKDSSLIAVTYGDTILTIEEARLLFTGGGAVSFGSEYQIPATNATTDDFNYSAGLTYNDSLNVSGNIIGDTIKANGRIGIGVSYPLSALHINKGNTVAGGLMFGTTGATGIYPNTSTQITVALSGDASWRFAASNFRAAAQTGRAEIINGVPTATSPIYTFQNNNGTGLGWNGTDQGSLTAGSKEIARFAENVTEQFIINPQGDLTGTLAAPNLAFTNSDLTTDVGLFLVSDNTLAVTVNSIEAMRLTEDTVFVDSVLKVGEIVSNGVMKVAKAQILYTNTSQTTIITLPTDAVVWDIGVNVVTLFDDSGADSLDIGITGETDRYAIDVPLSTTFFERTVGAGASNSIIDGNIINSSNFPSFLVSDAMSGSTNITFQYTGLNSDATQGTAYIYVHYTLH